MSVSFSFIHAADLHIASPFVGLTAQGSSIADRLRSSTFEAYDALVKLCLDRQVDFLLVAGDVYDGRDRSLRAQLAFRDGLARLDAAGIQAFVVHGNHDPLDGRMSSISWPDQTHIFDDRIATRTVEIGGAPAATVTGVSYPKNEVRDNLATDFPAPGNALFHIGLLHCNVGSNTGHEAYAPCDLSDLVGVGLDYWALGHVHTCQILSRDPWVVYPGNPQGRSFRECGPRGCYIVDVDEDHRAELEFVELDTARWGEHRASIKGVETVDALATALFEQLSRSAAETGDRLSLARIVLEGRGPLFKELRAGSCLGDLAGHLRDRLEDHDPQIWLQRIKLECRPDVDLAERAAAGDLLAEVLNLADEYLAEDIDLGELLDDVLSELYEHSGGSKVLSRPGPDEMRRFVESAKLLCFDLLDG